MPEDQPLALYPVGAVVQLNSGGPPLTVVISPQPDHRLNSVRWFDSNGDCRQLHFDPRALKPFQSR